MTRHVAISLVSLAAVLTACAGGTRATSPQPAPASTAPPAAAAKAGGERAGDLGLGFVLLERAQLPDATAVIAAYRRLAPDGPALETPEQKDDVATYLHGGVVASVALMPMPVPDGEADQQAQHGIMGLGKGWAPRPHAAHLVVMTLYAGTSPLERTRTAHRLIAAVAAAAGANAVGVYVGNGGVTHEPAFYVETVGEMADPMLAWSGISVARSDDRASLLSLGMRQFGLPEIELTFGTTPPGDAIAALYDLMIYVARRGEAIPDGDTIGRTAEQRIVVRYVPSPLDASVTVMRVEYP